MARPRKPKGEKKSRYLQVRISDDEKAAFDQAAATIGMDVSVWVRFILRKAAQLNRDEPPPSEAKGR